jgi:hypothetical protein
MHTIVGEGPTLEHGVVLKDSLDLNPALQSTLVSRSWLSHRMNETKALVILQIQGI